PAPQQPVDDEVDLMVGKLLGKRRHGVVNAVEFSVARIVDEFPQPLRRTVAGQVGRPDGHRAGSGNVRYPEVDSWNSHGPGRPDALRSDEERAGGRRALFER